MDSVIVIGAGIIGCACAAALAERGWRVDVIEAASTGGGATAAGMGHLVVMDDNPAELALCRRSLQLWRALAAAQPERHEYAQCGTLWVACDDEELAAAAAKQSVLAGAGVASELLDATRLQQAEPALRGGLAGALLVPGDALVYAPKSAAILLHQAQRHGARLVRGEVRQAEAGAVALADGSRLTAQHIVVANGLAAGVLFPELPLRAKKGQVLITDRYPGLIRHQLVELGYIKSAHAASGDSVAFNLQPRPTGQIMVGSSRQFDRSDRPLDHALLSRMLAQAVRFVPELAQLNAIRAWSGVRAATPDGLPLLGPHPRHRGVWLATGHEGLGVTTALASAELLAQQISGQPCTLAPHAYAPARFEL